jgi:hypothetical protein
MNRLVRSVVFGILLILGVAMGVWGAWSYSRPNAQPSSIFNSDERTIRLCPPSIGEILGSSDVGRKVASLVVFVFGLSLAGGSAISLMPKDGSHAYVS